MAADDGNADRPSPEELGTYEPGEPTRVPVVPPGSVLPQLATGISFPNSVIHWIGAGWHREPGATELAYGGVSIGDLWVELDDHGEIVREHERFVRADGTLLQEATWSAGILTTVYGPQEK